jgi:hypothetical protein
MIMADAKHKRSDEQKIEGEPKPFSYPFHAMTMIERFSNVIASRPNYKPDRPETLSLRNPACEHHCDKCYMGCAIAPARLAWWEGELAKACGASAIGRA